MKRERDIDILRSIGIIVMIIDHIGIGGGSINGATHFICPCFSLCLAISFPKKNAGIA